VSPRSLQAPLAFALVLAVVAPALTPAVAIALDSSSSEQVTPRLDTLSGDDPAPSDARSSNATVASVYPNPVVDGDRGEYVQLWFPTPTYVANWTLTDGETTIRLPNRTVSGTVLVAADLATARAHYANASEGNHTSQDETTTASTAGVHAPGLALANGGESLELVASQGSTVATLAYADAPAGEVYRDGAFEPIGATDHAPATTPLVDGRAFVTPDTPVPLAAIDRAEDRVSLAGYTFASDRVAGALTRAAARGVDVRVLVDDAPVGGVTPRQFNVLGALADSDVAVRTLGGDRARYDYHHGKYLVADDTAVVLTENWKPSGTGGHANRGWGVVLHDSAVADDLADVFVSDWTAPDARSWDVTAGKVTADPEPAANATYPTRLASRNVSATSVTVVTAPDNAERVLSGLLANATDRVHVLQMTAERDGALVRDAIAAARRGVDVRILLSSAWYARENNGRLVDALNALADRESLPLEARLVDPNGRFRKVHAKGVVVDDAVVLGSINWNDHSLRENREVAVVLRGDGVARYYADAFDADWQGGGHPPVPIWLAIAAALAALALLVVLAKHVDIAGEN
jgi:phosphatidylserine/phosphatidylglycerophosphate/cardiolipin synthase-like enzyme